VNGLLELSARRGDQVLMSAVRTDNVEQKQPPVRARLLPRCYLICDKKGDPFTR
jgi:hypothetical protein